MVQPYMFVGCILTIKIVYMNKNFDFPISLFIDINRYELENRE